MTSTVAEHWCSGSSTRNIPWLKELVPEPMIEMPEALARKLGVRTGDWVKVSSARGEVVVKAVPTPRMKSLQIDGQEVTIVWMPYNWGFQGLSTGPSANHLTIDAVDPGAGTQETKACLVNVVKASAAAGQSSARRGEHHDDRDDATPVKSTLIDITKCIGCRACQVACKHWNERDGEETEFEAHLGFQNPTTLSAKTLTLITYHELPDEAAPGGLHYLFTMRRCLHCLEPACASACPTTALRRQTGRTRHLRCRQVHRVPLLHMGVPLGRSDHGMGLR